MERFLVSMLRFHAISLKKSMCSTSLLSRLMKFGSGYKKVLTSMSVGTPHIWLKMFTKL